MRSFVLSLAVLAGTASAAEHRPPHDSNPPAIRGSAGEIRLFTLDEQPVMLSDYGAPVTVLALWATWCEPCLKELPYLEELHQGYKGDRDVSIVAISIDRPERLEAVRREVQKLKLSVPVLIDADRHLRSQLSVPDRVPLLIFIDRKFKLLQITGFDLWHVDNFLARLRGIIERARAGQLE